MRLRREDVLAGALNQLDRDGLDGLTMQALASSLGVRPGALYWHYADKRTLIDAMAEEIVSGSSYSDNARDPWDERLHSVADALHASFLSRRDGARLVAGTYVAKEQTLKVAAVLVEIVTASGLTLQHAAEVALLIFYYILGYTIEEQSRLSLQANQRLFEHQTQVRELAPSGVGEAIVRAQTAETFSLGVRLFIAGIRAEATAS